MNAPLRIEFHGIEVPASGLPSALAAGSRGPQAVTTFLDDVGVVKRFDLSPAARDVTGPRPRAQSDTAFVLGNPSTNGFNIVFPGPHKELSTTYFLGAGASAPDGVPLS